MPSGHSVPGFYVPPLRGCGVTTASRLVRGAAAAFECFLHQRVAGGSDQAAVVVCDDLNWHVFEDRFHAAFVEEGLHKSSILHFGRDLGGDDSADVDAAGRHVAQGAVSRFSSEYTHKN